MENTQKFDPEINNSESYKNINDTYLKVLEEIEKKIETYFLNIQVNKNKILEEAKVYSKTNYLDLVLNVENSLKEIESSMANLDQSNQLEVKRLKKKIDDTSRIVEDPKFSYSYFEDSLEKLNKKLKNLKLSDLLKEDLKFSMGGHLSILGWSGNSDPQLIVTSGGSSYKCWVSTALFEYEFTCRVKLISIENSKISGYWNYGFGVMREGKSTNQSSYYSDSAILQSNGHTNVQFSGSSNTSTSLTSSWKNDDILGVYRDLNGDIYFNINDGEKVKGFSNIQGNFNIVLGFSASCVGEVFEMIDCYDKFDN